MITKKIILSLLLQVCAIGAIAFACITLAVYAIPHLPLADKNTFFPLLHIQMTIDHAEKQSKEKNLLLLLGSSVVERGIDDNYLDTLLMRDRLPFFSINSGASGSFANGNLVLFRAMLERGLKPERVIYGTFLQEFNGKFLLHLEVTPEDTALIKLKEKNLWNVMRYGALSLSPIIDPPNFHIYTFTVNNAFRTVQEPDFLQRLSFGVNMYERDSSYKFHEQYLQDLKAIYVICKSRNIPFALFNTPVRPRVESYGDLPYFHKIEAYYNIQHFAEEVKIPIWNFDNAEFKNDDFLDTYHLNARGAHRMTNLLESKIAKWSKGIIEQDIVSLPDSFRGEVKDSLVRTVIHF
jgi:hypothetical protein